MQVKRTHFSYQEWLACGKPELEVATLYIDQYGQQMMHVDAYQGTARSFLLSEDSHPPDIS